MAIVVAAKKAASVIALMMIALLALFVSRPAIFIRFLSAATSNDIGLPQTCNRNMSRLKFGNFSSENFQAAFADRGQVRPPGQPKASVVETIGITAPLAVWSPTPIGQRPSSERC